MLRHNLVALENTADEILEAAREIENLANQICKRTTENPIGPMASADTSDLIVAWRACLELPHFYGGALPSLYYLRKHASEFLRE